MPRSSDAVPRFTCHQVGILVLIPPPPFAITNHLNFLLECQDQSSGKPYYACAPNDIWSLGVILVNLTCGRNPWKSASPKDSTFRAYMEDRHFLKTILPLSDELNDILGMIFELDPTKRIKLDELRQRILNCHQFTKSQLSAPMYTNPPYEEPLSPSSTISDEGSMISDHSDDSTVPSEVDPNPEDDFSSFEVMEEDCDFNLEPNFQGPLPDADPAPKVVIPKVWDGASIVSLQDPYESSLNTYVPAKPLEYGSSRIPAVAKNVPSAICSVPERPDIYQPSIGYSTLATLDPSTGPAISSTSNAPTSKPVETTHYISTEYVLAARWAKRSFARSRPNFRGPKQWQLRDFMLSHTLPNRINIPI